jgi:type II secretory pathway component PulF
MATSAQPSPYLYMAVSESGSRRFGVRAAQDEPRLATDLGRDRLLLLRAWRLPQWTARETGVPMADQQAINEQLAVLLDRGVTLIEALEVAGSVVGPATQERLRRMREDVSAGAGFSEACERAGGFNEIAIAVYRAAEKSGGLADACRRVAEAVERRRAIASKASTLLIYPAVLLVVSIVVTLAFLLLVVPNVSQMLISLMEDKNGDGVTTAADLPLLTHWIVVLSDAIRANPVVALLIAAAALIALTVSRRALLEGLLSLLRRIPQVRKLNMAIESGRFFAIMAAMTRSGVTLADALGVAAKAVSHPRLRTQLDDLQRGLVEGGAWRTLLEKVDELPTATRKLLIAAERSGDMDQALDAIAGDMAEEVDTRSERVLAALEPAIIVVMFLFIGTLMLALMLPMMSLTRNLI